MFLWCNLPSCGFHVGGFALSALKLMSYIIGCGLARANAEEVTFGDDEGKLIEAVKAFSCQ